MSKDEAQLALNKKPYGVVAARNDTYSHATIEVVQYTGYNNNSAEESYWLYFLNGKLDRWERADGKRTPII